MNIKKILMAAAATAVLSVAGASAASADTGYGDNGYNQDSSRYGGDNRHDDSDNTRGDHRDNNNGWHRGSDRHSGWSHDHRRFADRDTIFRSLRYHRIHYVGDPYFVRGHYVVRSFDRFGRVSFIEINPYTGDVIGVIRL
jgi:hypothetical protein